MKKEALNELIKAANDLKEVMSMKPSYISALLGAEDCDDSYQAYLEWGWAKDDAEAVLKDAIQKYMSL